MFTKKEKIAIIEGLKTGVRNIWFSILPVILVGINTEKGTFSINWMVILAVGVVSLITTVDSIMHEIGKVKENEQLEKGLSFGV